MNERTFRAERFQDAVARVKQELGPDAVILETKQLRGSSALGGRGQVEVRAVAPETAASLGIEFVSVPSSGVEFIERRLSRMGVPASAAKSIAKRVNRLLPRDPQTLAECHPVLAQALEEAMIFGEPVTNSGVRCVALVGATGVGKNDHDCHN